MYEIEYCVERDEEELELTVRGTVSKFIPGRFFGPPENCYPDEGGEAEIEAILLNGKPWTGELTPKEKQAVEELLIEEAANDGPDYEPDDDRDFDDRDFDHRDYD